MKKTLFFMMILSLFLIACQREQPIGGQTDEQGCLIAAGYSWNEDISACVREWELDEDKIRAAKLVVAPMSMRPVTLSRIDALKCPGCYDVYIKGSDDQETRMMVRDWKIFHEDIAACETDDDCVPLPGCHPHACINKEYEDNYEKPEICTMMYDNEAAYSAEDCICKNNVCENKNIAENQALLTLEQARNIADNSDCVADSGLEEDYFYNPVTKTWWIGLELEKEGCNPACVVDEETKTAEINWRCTGLIT